MDSVIVYNQVFNDDKMGAYLAASRRFLTSSLGRLLLGQANLREDLIIKRLATYYHTPAPYETGHAIELNNVFSELEKDLLFTITQERNSDVEAQVQSFANKLYTVIAQ